MKMIDGFPRRSRLEHFTPAEQAIWAATQAVEAAGCHPLLTDAVMLLSKARDKVADFVDEISPAPSMPAADSAKPSPTAASGQFVPTPHEPVEGVTLWNSSDEAAGNDGAGAAVRIDGEFAGYITPSGFIESGETTRGYAFPRRSMSFFDAVVVLTAFRDRIRHERRATSTASSADQQTPAPPAQSGSYEIDVRVLRFDPTTGSARLLVERS